MSEHRGREVLDTGDESLGKFDSRLELAISNPTRTEVIVRLDPDLFRRILIQLVDAPPNTLPDTQTPEGVDRDAYLEHLQLLADGGYIEAHFMRGGIGNKRLVGVEISRVTLEGHKFLDNARNETVWRRTLTFVREKGGSVSFDIVKEIAKRYAAQEMGLGG